jgi:hypothetical protein
VWGFLFLGKEQTMHLEFMTPDVWNGLVLGVVFIGLAFALLHLYRDLSRPPKNTSSTDTSGHQPGTPFSSRPFDPDDNSQ